jgi:hypothetical protein
MGATRATFEGLALQSWCRASNTPSRRAATSLCSDAYLARPQSCCLLWRCILSNGGALGLERLTFLYVLVVPNLEDKISVDSLFHTIFRT